MMSTNDATLLGSHFEWVSLLIVLHDARSFYHQLMSNERSWGTLN